MNMNFNTIFTCFAVHGFLIQYIVYNPHPLLHLKPEGKLIIIIVYNPHPLFTGDLIGAVRAWPKTNVT